MRACFVLFVLLCAAADAVHSGVWFTMERVGRALVQLLRTRLPATLSHALATSQLRHLLLPQRSSSWIAVVLSEDRLCWMLARPAVAQSKTFRSALLWQVSTAQLLAALSVDV